AHSLGAGRSAAWAAAFLCAVALVLLAHPASAAELAILRNGFSIRHEHRLVMGTTTRLYLTDDESSFYDVPTEEITGYEKDLSLPAPEPVPPPAEPAPSTAPSESAKTALPKPALPLNQVVNVASAEYHLDPDLVNSVIHAESGFNAHAVSPKGARGLMQLMPRTGSQLGVRDAFDPQANVTGGSRYLRELLERYNFDLVKALAAYNAGPERVDQYRGVPPFRETRNYVARIVQEYNKKKIAQEKQEKQEKEKQVKEAKQKQLPAGNQAPAKSAKKPPSKAPVAKKAPGAAQANAKPAATAITAESIR
ncbi:MAG: lytic transglycosylase domain-containing protein, partial [Terriglobales bacterium]